MNNIAERNPETTDIKENRNKIKKIDKREASDIMNNYKPIGLFMVEENGHYIGIDNSSGECWVEEFITEDLCLKWLKGEVEMNDFELSN
ncbi:MULTISPECIES: hypothetical protein [Bacillota]|uniref:hypothetical protein n=1 Tax=Bacillota TaxID=1239 RepID=UPI0039EEDBAD